MDSTSSSQEATADNDEQNPKSSRYFVSGLSLDPTRPTSSSSYESFRANEKELLLHLEATTKVRRQAVTKESPVLTRCYSDGKMYIDLFFALLCVCAGRMQCFDSSLLVIDGLDMPRSQQCVMLLLLLKKVMMLS